MLVMKKCLLIVLLFTSFGAYTQNRNSVWIFGDSAGIDFSNQSNPQAISSSMDGRGSCTSISDTSGGLIFYSYTHAGFGDWATYVYNKQNVQIQNGDSITGVGWYQELIIIPKDSNRFYLFSYGADVPNNEGLYYSLVDMNQNVGLGSVTLRNVQINPNRIADCLSAIKHGNGKDWWLLAKLYNAPTSNNRFFIFCISDTGISAPVVQDFAANTAYLHPSCILAGCLAGDGSSRHR